MNLLSIQSHVAYGHVGNDAAVFPLQRLGIEVWPIHTVQFSNHTGYETWKGRVFDADVVRDILDGIEERGVLGACDGVLSGYIGSAATGEAILDAVARVKRANPAALYCCDPVIGDDGRGVFVHADIPRFMKERALAAADLATPNHFELQLLTRRDARSHEDLHAALKELHGLGLRIILVTSAQTDDTPAGSLDLIASDMECISRLRTPRLRCFKNGAGDLIAALFLAHYLHSRSAAAAMSNAASSVFGILRRTAEKGARELLLVEAQDELVSPTQVFESERIG